MFNCLIPVNVLPATSVDLNSKFHIDLNGESFYLTLQQLAETLNPSAAKIIQETLIPTQTNQKTFVVPGIPENIIVSKGRTNLTPDSTTIVRDYNYNNVTGIITTTKGLVYNADPIQSEKLYITGFSNSVGSIQIIEITQEDQTEVFYSGAPSFLKVIAGRTNMIEGLDFTRTKYSSNNKITFTKGKALNSTVTIIKF